MRWIWEQPDANRAGAAGNLAKLFKNESVKNPGVLAIGAPSAGATVLAREMIQNSWDAANELRSDLDKERARARRRDGRSGPSSTIVGPPFEICFDFRTIKGQDKENLVEQLALNNLAARLRGGKPLVSPSASAQSIVSAPSETSRPS